MHKNEIKCKYVSNIMYSLVIKMSYKVFFNVGTLFEVKLKAAIVTHAVWQIMQ